MMIAVRLCVDIVVRVLAGVAVTGYTFFLGYLFLYDRVESVNLDGDDNYFGPLSLLIFAALMLPSPFSTGSLRIKRASMTKTNPLLAKLTGGDADESVDDDV